MGVGDGAHAVEAHHAGALRHLGQVLPDVDGDQAQRRDAAVAALRLLLAEPLHLLLV